MKPMSRRISSFHWNFVWSKMTHHPSYDFVFCILCSPYCFTFNIYDLQTVVNFYTTVLKGKLHACLAVKRYTHEKVMYLKIHKVSMFSYVSKDRPNTHTQLQDYTPTVFIEFL